jgi:hypothetical protein
MVRWMKFLEDHESEDSKDGADLLQMMELVEEGQIDDSTGAEGQNDVFVDQNAQFHSEADQVEEGKKLLQMLEKGDEEIEWSEVGGDDQDELDKSVVEKIMKEKEKKQVLKPCGNKNNAKEKRWGPVLLDRPRRCQNTGETMLQKAMNIKQKKNLEVVKGNSFSVLQTEYLNQVAHDADIKIGCDSDDNSRLIDSLKNEEGLKYNKFVNDNPDMALHANLDIEIEM